jgi:hypothetical protein
MSVKYIQINDSNFYTETYFKKPKTNELLVCYIYDKGIGVDNYNKIAIAEAKKKIPDINTIIETRKKEYRELKLKEYRIRCGVV